MRENRGQITAASVPEAVYGAGLASPSPNSLRETILYDSLNHPGWNFIIPTLKFQQGNPSLNITQSLSSNHFEPNREGPGSSLLYKWQTESSERGYTNILGDQRRVMGEETSELSPKGWVGFDM